MNSMPFRQLKSFFKILIGVQYDRMKESNFLILFVGCALLRLFKILAGRVHIEFNFPKLPRILPDGFELGIGFGMLLFQSGIRNFRNEKSWIPVAL